MRNMINEKALIVACGLALAAWLIMPKSTNGEAAVWQPDVYVDLRSKPVEWSYVLPASSSIWPMLPDEVTVDRSSTEMAWHGFTIPNMVQREAMYADPYERLASQQRKQNLEIAVETNKSFSLHSTQVSGCERVHNGIRCTFLLD